MLVKKQLDELEEMINAIEERIDENDKFVDDDSFQTLYDDLFLFNTETIHYEIENYPWDDSQEDEDKYFLKQLKRLERLELRMGRIIRVRYELIGQQFDWMFETEKERNN